MALTPLLRVFNFRRSNAVFAHRQFNISYRLWLAAMCMVGWWLRLPLLARFPLREDESLYAYWALHFLYEDPYFLTVWPDKPPVFLWALAGALLAFQPETFVQAEVAARWVNVAASLITIPLTASVARQVWGARAGMVAAALVALSPFAIAFAPTVYTDPVLVLGGMAALACAVSRRWFWSGMWLGVAVMTKQQGLFYVPLIGGLWLLVWQMQHDDGRDKHTGLRSLGLLVAGFLLVAGPIVYWDSLRWAVAPSPWDLAQRTYSPIALASLGALPERLRGWLGQLYYLGAAWWVWAALGCVLVWRLALWRPGLPARGARRSYATATFLLYMSWSALFIAAHWLTTVQIWDRYLLPLVPMLALGVGWLVAGRRRTPDRRGSPLLLLALLLAWPAWAGAQGRLPIGADHGDYAGLHEALIWLDAHGGATSSGRYVVYHQVFGWHLPFYFFGEMRAGRVTPRWFPSPPALSDSAAKTPYPPKYVLMPVWAAVPDVPLHLRARNMTWETRLRVGNMRVMEIVRLSHAACAWCVCAPNAETDVVGGLRLVQVGEPAMMSQP